MQYKHVSQGIYYLIIVIIIFVSLHPISISKQEQTPYQNDSISAQIPSNIAPELPLTWYSYDGSQKPYIQQVKITPTDTHFLIDLYNSIHKHIRSSDQGAITELYQKLKTFSTAYNLKLPKEPPNTIQCLLKKEYTTINPPSPKISPIKTRASEFFNNYASTGWGIAIPVIIFPRVIPIILSPLPRIFLHWSARVGMTSCGGLLTNTGFQAIGEQRGFALGFWGIGFSIYLPPLKSYGLFGYALFTSVTANNIKYFDVNYPPEVTALAPENGAVNVPLTTTELRFELRDFENQLMSYAVTTNPYIGAGNGANAPDGEYSVNISGLQPSTHYSWTAQVSDGEHTIEESYSFTTSS